MWFPFLFLLIGFIFSYKLKKWADPLIRLGLAVLLLGMGFNVGSDEKLLAAIPRLGLESLLFCSFSCLISIFLVVFWEKNYIKERTYAHVVSANKSFEHEYKFITLVLICLLFGIGISRQTEFLTEKIISYISDSALVLIYIGIGISMRFALKRLVEGKKTFLAYLLLPILITTGSVIGGIIAGIISGENLRWSAAIGGGMAYYSLATAMITDQAGLHIGLIAFISNFMRELFTFFLAPVAARYSNMAAIALGATSTMDTTLGVMKASLPGKYTVLAFFDGLILSFVVPVLLVVILH